MVLILAAEAADAVGDELEVLVPSHGGVYRAVRTWSVPERRKKKRKCATMQSQGHLKVLFAAKGYYVRINSRTSALNKVHYCAEGRVC